MVTQGQIARFSARMVSCLFLALILQACALIHTSDHLSARPSAQAIPVRSSLLGKSPDRLIHASGGKEMPTGAPTDAPIAFLEMCERSPEDCTRSTRDDVNELQSDARSELVRRARLAFTSRLKPEPHAPGFFFSNLLDRPKEPTAEFSKTLSERLFHSAQNRSTLTSDLTPSKREQPNSQSLVSKDEPGYTRLNNDKALIDTLIKVNLLVNLSVRRVTDIDLYHVSDYWSAPGLVRNARGDCEDLALQKRRELIKRGIPASALSLALVRTRFGDEHAVLLVSITSDDLVMDSLGNDISSWRNAPYFWIERQSANDDLGWVSLLDAN